MLAISRALMSRPKLVVFDEPSLGLAPNVVERTFEIIQQIRAEGVTVVMVTRHPGLSPPATRDTVQIPSR